MKFNWDSNKNFINENKHHVSFDEAQTVFYDENAKVIYDPDHSEKEDRYIILGLSHKLRILVVCHCYLDETDEIRIISARKATTNEQKQYIEIEI